MNLKVDSYFYNFSPSGSGRFTTDGEHQLSNVRSPQKIDTRRLLCFSRFNANLQMLTLVFSQLLPRTRARIINLYFKYCTFSLVPCSPAYLSRKWLVSGRDSVSQIKRVFLFATTYRRLWGTLRLPPGRKRSYLHGIQQPDWQTEHISVLVSSFRMHDSLLPPLVRYTNMTWSFGSGVNIFSLTSFVNRKALKKNLSNYYGYGW
jgi:hypothetical protein